MPALKTKTNLVKPEKQSPPLNKPYARKQTGKGKTDSKKPKTKATVAKENSPPGGAIKQRMEVEIVIERPVRGMDRVVEEDDELASAGSDEGYLDHESAPNGRPLQNPSAAVPRTERLDDQSEEAGFWRGDDHESISDLIDDLLKKDNSKASSLKGDAGVGIPPVAKKNGKGQAKRVDEDQNALESDKKEQKPEGRADNNRPILPEPFFTASLFTQAYHDVAGRQDPDLAHSIVIKVIEHALRKNIDWFTMAKELEAEGFHGSKKAVKTAKAKGKGKGKKVDPVDGEGEEVEQRKIRGKIDGNFLYDTFHYTILPALKNKEAAWTPSSHP